MARKRVQGENVSNPYTDVQLVIQCRLNSVPLYIAVGLIDWIRTMVSNSSTRPGKFSELHLDELAALADVVTGDIGRREDFMRTMLVIEAAGYLRRNSGTGPIEGYQFDVTSKLTPDAPKRRKRTRRPPVSPETKEQNNGSLVNLPLDLAGSPEFTSAWRDWLERTKWDADTVQNNIDRLAVFECTTATKIIRDALDQGRDELFNVDSMEGETL